MLSRVAENIYWLARYLERAEDTARLINSMTNLLLDLPRNAEVEWSELIKVTGAEEQFDELFEDRRDERTVMRFLISDQRNPSAIITCINMARENARVSRDLIPNEIWEQVNELYHYSSEYAKGSISRRRRGDFMSGLIRRCQTMTGIIMGTLPHDDAFRFLDMGYSLERADMSSRIIDVAVANLLPEEEEINPAFATVRWISVLKSLNAFQAYRQQGVIGVSGPSVLEYLLHGSEFPRSVKHCLDAIAHCLSKIHKPQAARRQLKQLLQELEAVDTRRLKRSSLHRYIDNFQLGISQLHTAIYDTYFHYE